MCFENLSSWLLIVSQNTKLLLWRLSPPWLLYIYSCDMTAVLLRSPETSAFYVLRWDAGVVCVPWCDKDLILEFPAAPTLSVAGISQRIHVLLAEWLPKLLVFWLTFQTVASPSAFPFQSPSQGFPSLLGLPMMDLPKEESFSETLFGYG